MKLELVNGVAGIDAYLVQILDLLLFTTDPFSFSPTSVFLQMFSVIENPLYPVPAPGTGA